LESYYEDGLIIGIKNHPLAVTKEDQFYYEYENIHPFRDGNGRTGKILYNYLLGTLDNPKMPPNFWGSSNP
jgi:fido (protein-threonine AMPylation protein)